MKRLSLLLALSITPVISGAGEATADKIARAQSAAHPEISRDATIKDVDGTVLKKGSNGWTCMPGTKPGDNHPMCNDAVWATVMSAAAQGTAPQIDGIGVSYMLQGDANVSNSDPGASDPNNGDVWVEEGPHLMIIAPKEMLKGVSDDPYNGGPYVMWKDTPYAHIMVPVREAAR